MKNLIKSLAIATLLAAATGTAQAQADKTISVEVTYNPNAPASEIYSTIDLVIKRACQKAYYSSVIVPRNNAIDDCREELVEQAINKIQMPALTAYFEQETGRKPHTMTMARNR